MPHRGNETSYRTIFLSDTHLGTRTAQAEQLLDFLSRTHADTIYLVGDIVDFWRVRRRACWPQSHNDVLQKLLQKARKGCRIIYIPGNHDEGLRDFCGQAFGEIEVHLNHIHTMPNGARYLVMHGDEFDIVVRSSRWLAVVGDYGYEFALWLNLPLNWLRRRAGLGYWSLSAFLKYQVKQAVKFIWAYENAVVEQARKRGVDGINCRHIHHPNDRMIGDIHYLNCGDWVENCTAICETPAGTFQLVDWLDEQQTMSKVAHSEPEMEAA